MKPEEIDDIFNDPNYEYGEPGEFSKDLVREEITQDILKAGQAIRNSKTLDLKKIIQAEQDYIESSEYQLSQSNTKRVLSIKDSNGNEFIKGTDSITDNLNTTKLIDLIVDKSNVKAVNTDKPYLFKKGQSGNPHGRPKKEKKTLSSVIEAKLNGEKLDPEHNEMHKFVDRLFSIFHTSDKNPMSAGIEILNRYEGKVKDVLQVGPITEHIPDQAEQLKIADKFKVGAAITEHISQ